MGTIPVRTRADGTARFTAQVGQASSGAFFAEVAVSGAAGETRVRRRDGTFAAGRILDEETARSQCRGGMIWSIGAALTEGIVFDLRDGPVVNRDLADRHIPFDADLSPIGARVLKERDDFACPIQSKGAGELGISGAGAAVPIAAWTATGLRDDPVRPVSLVGRIRAAGPSGRRLDAERASDRTEREVLVHAPHRGHEDRDHPDDLHDPAVTDHHPVQTLAVGRADPARGP